MNLPTPAEVDAFVARVFPAMDGRCTCSELGPDVAVARWHYDDSMLRPGGLISGPTQFATADLALWYLSFAVVGLKAMAVTADVQITFLRPASGGDLIARAELLRAGSSRISGRVTLWVDGKPDRPVSQAMGNYALLPDARSAKTPA